MAYNMKDVFYLDTAIDTGTTTGDGVATLDLSSYVDPISRGRAKGTGLAIYKVHFDICDDNGNDAVASAATGQFRAGLISFSGVPAAAVGSASIANNTLNASNDLMIAGVNFAAGGTAAGDPPQFTFLEPSKDVPYVVVRDQVVLMISVITAMSAGASVKVRLECAQVTLDQSTLNQLLRTQTV
jgi:hypothetical protein|tara:strand:- start:1036 stop:1587 length:552 start_codon:yes stop_codon:yes gene_type:complete